jgi:hypothetical protein
MEWNNLLIIIFKKAVLQIRVRSDPEPIFAARIWSRIPEPDPTF